MKNTKEDLHLNINSKLYQKMVSLYTENHQLPPLAAKICAYLNFDFNGDGITFEELVEVLKASKSSVSCSLQMLVQSGHIIGLNKIDERKRFFVLNPDYVKIRFNMLIDKLEKELDILEDLKTFRQQENVSEKKTTSIKRLNIYIDLLKSNINNFTQTLEKLYQ